MSFRHFQSSDHEKPDPDRIRCWQMGDRLISCL